MKLPPGVVDPIYLCETAERLHMSIAEITHGRGTPMSAHELCVTWPLYDDYKRREADRQAAQTTPPETFA